MIATESVPTTGLRRAFFGPAGLRAGWRVLMFIVLMAAFEFASGPLLNKLHALFGEGETAGAWLVLKSILFLYVLLVVLILGKFENRGLTDYGLPLRKIFGKDFWAGTLWGCGLLSVNFILMAVTHAYSFGSIALSSIQIIKFGSLWAAANLMVGLAEEFVFRGYLLYWLTRGIGFWPSAIVTSALFGLTHFDVPGEPWPAVANIALLSLLLCLALQRTGNLWFAIGSHMSFDWALTFFFSVTPNTQGHLFNSSLHGSKWLTGGSAGPEGNIFNVFLVPLGILLLAKAYPHVKYPANGRTVSD